MPELDSLPRTTKLLHKKCSTRIMRGKRIINPARFVDVALLVMAILNLQTLSSTVCSMTCFFAETALKTIWAIGELIQSKITSPKTSASGRICKAELMKLVRDLIQAFKDIVI